MNEVIGIKDVAKIANVGISTVSRVLNNSAGVSDELRARVLEAVEKSGYTSNPVARMLKSARTNNIALLVTSLKRNFYINIIRGITDVCKENQFSVHILQTGDSIEEEINLVDTMVKQWVDGIILVTSVSEWNDLTAPYLDSLSQLKKRDIPIPVVQLEVPCLNPEVDSVVVDHEAAAFHAVSHLLEIGRRKIAYISIPEAAPMAGMRMKGYLRALAAAGIEVDRDLISFGHYEVLDGYNCMKEILQRGKDFDGLFGANDQMAVGAMYACKEAGLKVPEDVAVIGHDNVAMSALAAPAVSTISVSKYKYGQAAAHLLLDRIRNPKAEGEKAKSIQINMEVLIRESTLKSAKKSLEFLDIE